MSRRPSSSGSPQTPLPWKSSATGPSNSNAARLVLRLLLTTAFIALVALFAYLWIEFSRRDPSLRVIAVAVDYRMPYAPPIPFARRDAGSIAGLASTEPKIVASLGELIAELGTRSADPRDNLLVYVSAHGISNDGQAELLDQNGVKTLALNDLLDALRGRPATLKLLVLDSGRMETDPVRGMLVNEFPRLLEASTRSKADGKAHSPDHDPSLWIINSNAFWQRSHVSYRRRASLMAACLEEALRGTPGQAGGTPTPQGGRIMLDDVARYVQSQVEKLSLEESRGAEPQHPVLLRDGQGIVEPKDLKATLFVAKAAGAKPTTPPNPDSSGAGGGTKNAAASSDSSKTGAGGEPAGKAAAWPADLPPLDQLREPWERRDVEAAKTWRLVDFRPHSWRIENEQLVGCELLGWGEQKAAAVERRTVLGEWGTITDDRWDTSPAATSLHRVAAAVKLRDDCLFKLPYVLQWLAHGRIATHSQVNDLLGEGPESLRGLLKMFDKPDKDSPLEWLERLGKTAITVDARLKTIIDGAVTEACGEDANVYQIEDLLATPLPSKDDRQRLLEKLFASPASGGGTNGSQSDRSGAVGRDNVLVWKRLTRAAELECRVAGWFDPTPSDLGEGLGQIRDEDAAIDALKRYGARLQACYQALRSAPFDADRIGADWNVENNAAELNVRLLPSRVDPRSAEEERALTRRRFPELNIGPAMDVQITTNSDDGSGKVRLDWSIASNFGKLPDKLEAWLECDDPEQANALRLFTDAELDATTNSDKNQGEKKEDDKTKIDPSDGAATIDVDARPIKWGRSWQVKSGSDGKAAGRCWILVKEGQEVEEVKLTFHVSGDDARSKPVTASFARLKPLEWQVVRYGDPKGVKQFQKELPVTQTEGEGHRCHIDLRPYPGAPTVFGIKLMNPSGRKRTVVCAFYRVESPTTGSTYEGWDLPWNEHGDLTSVCKPVGIDEKRSKVEIKAHQPVEFPIPPSEFPVPQPSAEVPAAGAQAPIDIDASYGFVCVAEEERSRGKVRYLAWLDARRPLHPREYVDEPDVKFDETARKIEIVVAQKAGMPFRPGGSTVSVHSPDKPLARANPTDDRFRFGPVRTGDQPARAVIAVPKDFDDTATVWVSVDEYARAFVFSVDCSGKANRGWCVRRPGIEIAQPLERAVFQSRSRRIAFALHVDAPPETLGPDGDEVRLFWRGAEPGPNRSPFLQFDRDRDVTVAWKKPKGDERETTPLVLEAKVVELTGEIELPDTDETRRREPTRTLRAEFKVGGRVAAYDERQILIDDEPPKVAIDGEGAGPMEVPASGPLELRLTIDDVAGVKSVEIGWPGDVMHTLSEAPLPVAAKRGDLVAGENQERGAETWVFQAPLKKLFPDNELVAGKPAWLRILAVDKADNVASKDFSIVLAPPPKPGEPAKANPTVYGRVLLDGKGVSRAVVTLKVADKVQPYTADDLGYIKVNVAAGVLCLIQAVENRPGGPRLVCTKDDPWTISVKERSRETARKIVVKPAN